MKKLLLLPVLLLCIFSLVACNDNADELTIVAEDAVDVPAGEYTLQYIVTNYEKYHDSYDLRLTVNVYDEENKSVTVTNNRTVTLSTGKTYTVIIRLNGKVGDKPVSQFKKYTIKTVQDDVTVSFYLKDGQIVTKVAECTLGYGESIPAEELPELVEFYAAQNNEEGHVRTIISKKWVVYDDDENYHDLSETDLTDITESFSVYSHYEYDDRLIENTVTFAANGGSETAPFKGTAIDTLLRPTSPTKEGCVFLGWCSDEELTTYFNWRKQTTVSTDFTLYAKWAEDNSDVATPDAYFNFTEGQDNYGNRYYTLSVKDKARLSGDLVLPSCHNGLPVRALISDAFSNTAITSVYVPETYTLEMHRAFVSCHSLQRAEFETNTLKNNLDIYMFFDCTALTSVKLPGYVETIDEGCFSGCLNLTDVDLPEKLTMINEKAFLNCHSLVSVDLPDSVCYILDYAYQNCALLSQFTVSSNSLLESIASSAFNGTALDKLTLPSRLKSQVTLQNTNITIDFYAAEQAQAEE